jgi:ribonuclease P protein component
VVTYVLPTEREVRAGFVCGRSVGGAVVRNRARRQIKEAWRDLRPKAQGTFDVVFVARPEVRGAKTQELIEEMLRALTELGAITA